MPKSSNYRPLPDEVTIAQSNIEGLGLFAESRIEEGKCLGVSHIEVGSEMVRTPLGGFINHSEDPNCIRKKIESKWYLATTRYIEYGEELTLKYTFYTV